MTNVPKDIRKAIIEKIKYPELISGIWARKRVEVRPDPDVLMDMEEAKNP